MAAALPSSAHAKTEDIAASQEMPVGSPRQNTLTAMPIAAAASP